MRKLLLGAGVVACVLAAATPCAAQIGLGGQMSVVRGDVSSNTSAERFLGGHIRMSLSPRSALEVSIDRRKESNAALTERRVEIPLQGSLLLFPVRSTIAPYVLGGVGWYTTRIEQLTAGSVTSSTSSRRFGYHAGLGGELRLGRHAGAHADYRYTFLKFGNDADDSILGRVKPSYEGSMWTAGLTVYF
jgi:opacity protein-like surface antigen